MTKKQFGIIFTLLALIVCVGVLATKVNSTLSSVPGDLSDAVSFNSEEEDKNATEEDASANTESKDFFFDSRSEREQANASTVQNLKSITEDKNTDKAQKDKASKELTTITTNKENESKIEVSVKSLGFEDALCYIEGDKVRVIVKVKEPLSEKQSVQIQEIATSTSKLSEVIIKEKNN